MTLVDLYEQPIGPEAPFAFTDEDLARGKVLVAQIPLVREWQCADHPRNGKLDRAVVAVIDLAQMDDDAQYFAEILPPKLGVPPKKLIAQLIPRALA